jgi:hypothetical protein
MCQNIDDFNRGCALIMAQLYRSFPRPVVLDAGLLDGEESLFTEGRPPQLAQRGTVYVATVQFLADEGYLVFHRFDDWSAFSGARLTSKGLAALNRVPDALRPAQKTLGDRLIAITADLAGAAGKEAVKGAVQALLA